MESSTTLNRKFRYWTNDETKYLIENFNKKHIVYIAKDLDRTKLGIDQKIRILRLRDQKRRAISLLNHNTIDETFEIIEKEFPIYHILKDEIIRIKKDMV